MTEAEKDLSETLRSKNQNFESNRVQIVTKIVPLYAVIFNVSTAVNRHKSLLRGTRCRVEPIKKWVKLSKIEIIDNVVPKFARR